MVETVVYPIGLVPLPEYLQMIALSSIIDASCPLFVGRRMEGSPQGFVEIDDDLYLIPDEISQTLTAHVPDMSMNMLTNISRVDDLKWQQIKSASDSWEGNEVNVDDFRDCVSIVSPSYAIIYKASNLHHINIPYKKSFNSMKEYQEGKKYVDNVEKLIDKNFQKSNEYDFTAISKLEHKPTNMNYWHVTLDIYEPDKDTFLKNSKGKYRKDICDYVVDTMLKKNVRLHIDEPELDERFYKK